MFLLDTWHLGSTPLPTLYTSLIISFPRDQISHRSQENWICENELIIDFIRQNETKYNRISIPVLKRLTFEKTTENKSKRHMQNQSENKKSNNFFAMWQNITVLPKNDESCKSKRRQKPANYFEINRISTVLNKWPLSSFLCSSVVAEQHSKRYIWMKRINMAVTA